MAFQKDGKIYIKLDPQGEMNVCGKCWDDGIGGQIKQILLWCAEYFISGFQTIYEVDGKTLTSKRRGGSRGNFETINPEKPLTWLSGHYGTFPVDPELFDTDEETDPWNFYKRISSLKFGNKEETFGPFGVEDGTPFFFRGSNEIVGFHGCSNDDSFGCISTIGVYIKTEAVGFVGQLSNANGYVEMIEEVENKPKLISGNWKTWKAAIE